MRRDYEIQRLAELREKAIHDEASALDFATQKGLKLGREEGLKQGLAEGLKQGIEQGIEQGRKSPPSSEIPLAIACAAVTFIPLFLVLT